MNPLNLLRAPVVQDLAIALALNPGFREAEPVRQMKTEILGDLQRFRREVLGFDSVTASSRPILAGSGDLLSHRSRRLAAARIRGIELDMWNDRVAPESAPHVMELAALRVHGADEIRAFFRGIERNIVDVAADTELHEYMGNVISVPWYWAGAMLFLLSVIFTQGLTGISLVSTVGGLLISAVLNPIEHLNHFRLMRSWSLRADRIVDELEDGKKSWWLLGSSRKLHSDGPEHLGTQPSESLELDDLLVEAMDERYTPMMLSRIGHSVTAELYVDQLFSRDAESGEPVMILTARIASAPLK